MEKCIIHSTSYKTHHCFQTYPNLSIVWNSITSLGNSLVRVASRDKKKRGYIQKYKTSKITFSIFFFKKVKKLFSHSIKGQKTSLFFIIKTRNFNFTFSHTTNWQKSQEVKFWIFCAFSYYSSSFLVSLLCKWITQTVLKLHSGALHIPFCHSDYIRKS